MVGRSYILFISVKHWGSVYWVMNRAPYKWDGSNLLRTCEFWSSYNGENARVPLSCEAVGYIGGYHFGDDVRQYVSSKWHLLESPYDITTQRNRLQFPTHWTVFPLYHTVQWDSQPVGWSLNSLHRFTKQVDWSSSLNTSNAAISTNSILYRMWQTSCNIDDKTHNNVLAYSHLKVFSENRLEHKFRTINALFCL